MELNGNVQCENEYFKLHFKFHFLISTFPTLPTFTTL